MDMVAYHNDLSMIITGRGRLQVGGQPSLHTELQTSEDHVARPCHQTKLNIIKLNISMEEHDI